MFTAPQVLPAHGDATRTGQELCALSLSGLFQWNVTCTRPYLSTAMSSSVSLPVTTAVCRPTMRGLGVVCGLRKGWLLAMASKLQRNGSTAAPSSADT